MQLSNNDPALEVKLRDLANSLPSITFLVAAPSSPASPGRESSRPVNASDSLIHTVLSLITKRDLITEQSSKFLVQYFQFFNMYSSIGVQQCFHLIRCDVPLTLMQFALDELPMTNSNLNLNNASSQLSSSFSLNYVKFSNSFQGQMNTNYSSQYADLNKLYCVLSTLLRCYDVSPYCASSIQVK